MPCKRLDGVYLLRKWQFVRKIALSDIRYYHEAFSFEVKLCNRCLLQLMRPFNLKFQKSHQDVSDFAVDLLV